MNPFKTLQPPAPCREKGADGARFPFWANVEAENAA